MGKKRTGDPRLLNNQGVKRMWEAAIKQAVEDLIDGGIEEYPNESKITKQRRVFEAYHWLMTERSDAAFESQDVYSDEIRAVIRKKIKNGNIHIDLKANLTVRRQRTAQIVASHVNCPCWKTGKFVRVEGCSLHPWDL